MAESEGFELKAKDANLLDNNYLPSRQADISNSILRPYMNENSTPEY